MNPDAMTPFGAALQAYQSGDTTAELLVRRDDGLIGRLPVAHFFRKSEDFSRIDCEALSRCHGRVLDAGAGTGVHTLELQRRGFTVTAIDICPQAVEVMRRRGVREAVCSDVFSFAKERFNTILLMGHGIGMTETIAGLDRFLQYARALLAPGGQILLDSNDPAVTDDPQNVAYHAANRRAGRYIGEVRMRFEFRGDAGPYCGWLHTGPETLSTRATAAGWSPLVVLQEANGDYLARLTPEKD